MRTACRRLLCLVILLFATPVRAADPPLDSPEQKVLDKWLGRWRTTYKTPKAEWTPEEKAGTADVTNVRVIGGRFLQEAAEHSDKTSATSLYTYDAEKKRYRGWWFSSAGQTAEWTGTWDAATKTMTWTSAGEFPATARHRFVDDDNTEWDVTVKDAAGKIMFRMEGKGVRAKEPRP